MNEFTIDHLVVNMSNVAQLPYLSLLLDHGIFRDGRKEIPEAQHPLYRRILLQDLNRQGAVVLEGKTLESDGVKEEERRNRISKMIQIEDLQAQDGHPVAPLCIKDPRDYFDSQQANAVKTLDDSLAGTEQTRCSLGYEEAYGSLRASISKIETKGLNDPLLSPEVALKNTSWTVALVYGFFKQAGCHSLPVFLSTPSHKSHINWVILSP
ncbi:BSD domain (BTF2 transcription factor, Synapse-associated protein and DOS2-like protein) [Trifolium repens]|nr:BSD domain (BTF2 transcription factor, Synapse-associated protein and DOS2-like protein) [Trifolium repens]